MVLDLHFNFKNMFTLSFLNALVFMLAPIGLMYLYIKYKEELKKQEERKVYIIPKN